MVQRFGERATATPYTLSAPSRWKGDGKAVGFVSLRPCAVLIPNACMNIGFACEWKKNREQTWSHTPISLLQGLMAQRGHNIHDIDLRLSPLVEYALTVAALRYNARTKRLHNGYLFSPLHDSAMQKKLRRECKKMKGVDAVISMGDYGSIHPLPQYVYFDVSMAEYALINSHARYGQTEALHLSQRSLQQRVERQNTLFSTCTGIFSMSRHAANEYIRLSGIAADKVHVVHAGINVPFTDAPLPPPLAEPYILFVGRDFERKGGDIVVEAFQRLHPMQNIRLVIAGPARWQWGTLPKGVVFAGEVPRAQMQAYFQHALAYVMPSRYEAYGIAFAEALCAGVPVIARDAFAMKEMVQHGVNGYLMQADSDSPDELADLINTMVANTSMREYVQAHRHDYRAYYSWSRVAADMLKIIAKDVGKE